MNENSGAVGSPQPPELPENLRKFAGEGGALDIQKLSQSLHELERSFHEKSEENARLQEAIDSLLAPEAEEQASSLTPTSSQVGSGYSKEDFLRSFLDDPYKIISSAVRQELQAYQQPYVEQLGRLTLEQKHPELKDPEFRAKVNAWVDTLDPDVRELRAKVGGASFLVDLYKRLHEKTESSSTQAPPPVLGSPSSARQQTGGPIFSRAELRRLYRENPKEYARLWDSGAIEAAYREGRVRE